MIAPACVWTVNQAGRTVCATRRDLYSAVVQATRLPSGEKRTAAVLAAMEAHAAHSCDGLGFRKTGMGVNGPAEDSLSEASYPTPPTRGEHGDGVHVAPWSASPSLLDLHRHVLELSGAALVLGMRLEREAHPDAPADIEEKIAEAEKRMEAASEALLRALEKYRSPLRRMPISAYLPPNEEPAA